MDIDQGIISFCFHVAFLLFVDFDYIAFKPASGPLTPE